MGFLRDDIDVAMRKIHHACPQVVLQVWYDHGFRLAGFLRDERGRVVHGTYRVVMQPANRENNQPAYTADVDQLIFIWKLHLTTWSVA